MKKILILISLSILVALSSCNPKRYLTTSRAPGVALDTINIGAYNNDPSADKARTAFTKANGPIREYNRLQLYNLEPTELAILRGATVTTAELNRLAGVTSAIQTQINGRVRAVDSTGNAAGNYVTRKALRDSITNIGVKVDSIKNLSGEVAIYVGTEALPPHIPDGYADDPYDIFPEVHAFAGDTSNYSVPDKIGDLFINTVTSKVYVSVSTSRGGWVILNMILPLLIIYRRRRRK